MVPNLLPLGIAFGCWAMISGEINFTMSIVLGMALGVIVDDTIHFLSKYLHARRSLNLSPEDAIVYSFRTVGTALLVTSIVLACGFMILSFSAFLPNSGMGQLTVLAIVAALFTDFFLLPPLLLMLDRNGRVVDSNSDTALPEEVHHEALAS